MKLKMVDWYGKTKYVCEFDNGITYSTFNIKDMNEFLSNIE